MLKKRGMLIVVLALLTIVFSINPSVQGEVAGCYIYSQASEDLYCVGGITETQAKTDCKSRSGCDSSQHFLPGSDCLNIAECKKVTCNVDCQVHASGKCTQLGGKEVSEQEYDLWCSPGCCKIEKANFCYFGLNKFQCTQEAQKKLGDYDDQEVIFDNSLGMNTNKCNKDYCPKKIQKASLSITVINPNKKPLSGVQLSFEGWNFEPGVTDNTGKYIFSNLNPGKYLVKATLEGYTAKTISFSLSPGEKAVQEIILSPAEGLASIEGMVKDAQGKPIAAATVSWSGPANGKMFTNDNGGYTITNLPAGEYTFTASKISFSSQEKKLSLAKDVVPLFFTLQGSVFEGLSGKIYIDKNNNNEPDAGDETRYGAKVYANNVFKGYSQYHDGNYKIPLAVVEEDGVQEFEISASYQDYFYGPEKISLNIGQSIEMNLLLTKYIGECTYPNPPKDVEQFYLSLVPGKKEVVLKWIKPCPEVLGYEITKFKGNQQVGNFKASPVENSKIDSEVEWESTYAYEIKAVYDKQTSLKPAAASITLGNEVCEGKYSEKTGWDRFCLVDDKDARQKIWVCNDENQPFISTDCTIDFGFYYFCAEIGEHEAGCKNADVCDAQVQEADPFGLYYGREACYGLNNENFCYYDITDSVVNRCNRCDMVWGCFDYRSQDACLINNCLDMECRWVNGASSELLNYALLFPDLNLPLFVTPETGGGYCVETNYKKDDQCSLCGPEADMFENYFCTAEVCSALGRCFSNSPSEDQKMSYCASCGEEPSVETNCYTYQFESECNGGQNLMKNDRQEITLSRDRCSWERCLWQGTADGPGKCVKDGDGDNQDDCALVDNLEACRKDSAAPTTTFVSEEFNVVSWAYPNITFQAIDKSSPTGEVGSKGSPLGVLGFCLASADPQNPEVCTDFTEVPYPGKFSDETITVNLINSKYLQKEIPGETYMLNYYSTDRYFNQENVQTTFVYVDNLPPQFEINHKGETIGDITKLTVYLEGTNEPMECSFSLKQVLPSGGMQTKSVDRSIEKKEVIFEHLPGIKYNLSVTCEDNHGNQNIQEKIFTFDLEERITIIYPELQGAISSTSISFKVGTAAGASCGLYLAGNNEKVADFISDEEGKMHETSPVPRFIEKEYAGDYKVICTELLTEDTYEDYFHFIIDFTAPNTQIILQEGARQVYPKQFGWEEYFVKNAVVSFECSAVGFKCEKTFYCWGDGCESIYNPKYKEYTKEFMISNNTKICYFSTDKANNPVYQPWCGKITIEGYGITLDKPHPYYYLSEQWGISSQDNFTLQFYTKVPTTRCKFDFNSGFDYGAVPPHKIKEPDGQSKYVFEEFPLSVFSKYPQEGGIKVIYVQCENSEREIGPEQKINLEYDPTAPKIISANADPDRVYEGISTNLLVETDDKTLCRYSDDSAGTGSKDYDIMEYSFPGIDDLILHQKHDSKFNINFLGSKKDYRLNIMCMNGAGGISGLKEILFSVDYSEAGNIKRIDPFGFINYRNVTLAIETIKKALCKYKYKGEFEFMPNGANTNYHTAPLGSLNEKKYLIPVKCYFGDHIAEGEAQFTVDLTPPTINKTDDGAYTCGSEQVNVMVYTTEENISGYYYEIYDLGLSEEESSYSSNKSSPLFKVYSSFKSSKVSFFSASSKLVFNNSVGPGLPISVPALNLQINHNYGVKVRAKDAAGNWGEFAESDGFRVTAKNESICEKDNGAPEAYVKIDSSMPQMCTSTLVELHCGDLTGCTITYGTAPSAKSCNATNIYVGQKIRFDQTGWLCYHLEDALGNNYTSTREIVFADSDGDGIADDCDLCAKTDAGKVVDEEGCASGQVPDFQKKVDTDNDGLPDVWETSYNQFGCEFDSLNADSNGDGISDSFEDYDKDELSSYEEYLQDLDPCVADTPLKGGGAITDEGMVILPSALGKAGILSWILLITGLLMIFGGAGYLVYYHLYFGKRPGMPAARAGQMTKPQIAGSTPTSSATGVFAGWKNRWVQLRRAKEQKTRLRERNVLFGQFSTESKTIPHIDQFLNKKVPHLSRLGELAQKYSEHKEEIKPGLRDEEKSIFTKLENIAKKTKDKEIRDVVDTEEAKNIFSKLKEISKKRKM